MLSKSEDPRLAGTRRLVLKIPVTSPPTNQKLQPSPQMLPLKTPSLKAIREFGSFECELPILLTWFLQYKRCPFLHHNPLSVDGLCCTQASGPEFSLVTPSPHPLHSVPALGPRRSCKHTQGCWGCFPATDTVSVSPPSSHSATGDHICPGHCNILSSQQRPRVKALLST